MIILLRAIIILPFIAGCNLDRGHFAINTSKEKIYSSDLNSKRVPILNKRSIELAKNNVENYSIDQNDVGEISEISYLYKSSYKRLLELERESSNPPTQIDETNETTNDISKKEANHEVEELKKKISLLENELNIQKNNAKDVLIVPKISEQYIQDSHAKLLTQNSKILYSVKIYPKSRKN